MREIWKREWEGGGEKSIDGQLVRKLDVQILELKKNRQELALSKYLVRRKGKCRHFRWLSCVCGYPIE